MMGKALIKETGEIFDIQFHYKVMKMNFTFNYDSDDKIESVDVKEIKEKVKKEKKTSWFYKGNSHPTEYNPPKRDKNDEETLKKHGYYVLENGEKYFGDELIIGDDNIRDWKIKNIIDEGTE